MRTSNPALNDKTFSNVALLQDEKMTIQGTVNKAFFCITAVFVTAYWSWQQMEITSLEMGAPTVPSWYFPVIIISLITAIVIIFKKTWAPVLVPAYSVLQGATLGALSALFELRYPGIVFQAVLLTFGTFLSLLFIYKLKLIKVTENFKIGIVAATGGIAIVYLIDLGMSFFIGKNIPVIHESSPMGIAFSLFVVAVAAFNLVLDFDFIEKGSEQGAPKYMEWYGAFGLLVTLIWLYLEILRLLSKMKKR